TRNFSARLPEERAVTLAAELARELARAHAESPPRHPDLDPATVVIVDGHPRLDGAASETPAPDAAEDLFRLGGVLYFMATGERPARARDEARLRSGVFPGPVRPGSSRRNGRRRGGGGGRRRRHGAVSGEAGPARPLVAVAMAGPRVRGDRG